MEVITLKQEKSQIIGVSLNDQDCTLRLFQMPSGMYIDVFKNSKAIVLGVPCIPLLK